MAIMATYSKHIAFGLSETRGKRQEAREKKQQTRLEKMNADYGI
jgi:hypothetical protein